MDRDKIDKLIKELREERLYLDRRGYSFPALYESIEFLLQKLMPDD